MRAGEGEGRRPSGEAANRGARRGEADEADGSEFAPAPVREACVAYNPAIPLPLAGKMAGSGSRTNGSELYEILGVPKSASDTDIKKVRANCDVWFTWRTGLSG